MTFDAAEKHQSQIPALQMLVALGFTPLSQSDALSLRGGRLRNVVLDDVLAESETAQVLAAQAAKQQAMQDAQQGGKPNGKGK